MTALQQQQDALGFVHLIKRHFDRASMSLPREVWERMNAILAGPVSQQSNPATLREALWEQLEERARQECPKGSHEDHECETCEHCHYYVDTAWIGVETALAASGTEAAPRLIATEIGPVLARLGTSTGNVAAASPEGEGREGTKAEAEVWLERNGYPYLEQMFNEFVDGPISRSRMNRLLAPLFVKYAALRQSAAPSGGATLLELAAQHCPTTKSDAHETWLACTCGWQSGPGNGWVEMWGNHIRALAQESKTGAVTETK